MSYVDNSDPSITTFHFARTVIGPRKPMIRTVPFQVFPGIDKVCVCVGGEFSFAMELSN